MSAQQVIGYNKADISFLYGYRKHRNTYRRIIFLHAIEITLFVIFIPIDASILNPEDRIIVAQAVALAVACISFCIRIYQYYICFTKYGVEGYSQIARDIAHVTQQPVISAESIQSCTSQTVVHAASFVTIEGLDQRSIDVYANVALQELQDEMSRRFKQLRNSSLIQQFLSLSSIIIVIIMMSRANQINAAQIAVLCVYLFIEAFIKLKFLIVLCLVALSPILCIGLIIYACCFSGHNQGRGTLDLGATQANLDHVVKCGGECSICMQDIKLKESVYQLPCSDKHIFHTGCLDKWMHVRSNCPICRANLPTIEVGRQNPSALQNV